MEKCDLEGKIAVVTGASSGLGRHFATLLAERGAIVFACARRVEVLEGLSESLRTDGKICHPVVLDVTDPGSVARAFAEIARIAGTSPDIVVNNAGAAKTRSAVKISEEDWTSIIDLNLNGVFRVAQAAARQMIEAEKGGSIINIASILGLRVARGVASYAASKAAVIHLSKALALEWALHGIRVNAIAPGYIETDLNRDFFQSEGGKRLIDRIPRKAVGALDDLDGALLLLSSAYASNMTGTILTVDGGHLVSEL